MSKQKCSRHVACNLNSICCVKSFMPSVVEALQRALVSVLLEVARVYSLSLTLVVDAPADPLRHPLNCSWGVCALNFQLGQRRYDLHGFAVAKMVRFWPPDWDPFGVPNGGQFGPQFWPPGWVLKRLMGTLVGVAPTNVPTKCFREAKGENH